MKKIILLLLALCVGITIWAQEKKVSITSHVVKPADIDNDGYIIQQIRLEEKTTAAFSIKNIQAEMAEELPAQLEPASSFTPAVTIGKERKKPVAIVRIPVYRKDQGKTERLLSYDLEMTTSTTTQTDLAGRPTGVENSVLKSGNWYKIAIDKRGIYKIDYAFLQSMGITPSTINPANIRVYGNGGTVLPEAITGDETTDLIENSIFVSAAGSTFGTGDYILFYANGPVKWDLNTSENRFVHTPNYYENNSYYFINFDIGPGKRINAEAATGTADVSLTSFDEYAVIDVDSFNPGTIGKIWWSNRMNSAGTSTQTQTLSMNMGQLEGPLTLETVVGGTMDASGSTVRVAVNGSDITTLTLSALAEMQAIDRKMSVETFNPSSGNLELKMKFSPVGTGMAYLDYFRFNARRKLSMASVHQLSFRDIASGFLPSDQQVAYKLQDATGGLKVWDVTDMLNPVSLSGTFSGGQYTVVRPAGALKEFIAFDGASYNAPTFVGKIDNQNLHGMDQVDFLIVTRSDFLPAAEELANFHREQDGLKVAVVTVDKIYNEFSSGGQDIAAIRNFIKMFYDRAATEADMLKNVLFLGAASYDYKNRIPNNSNIVPTYQTLASYSTSNAYSTDDFYSLMDSGEALETASILDIGVGRIPAYSLEEAQQVVKKIKNYKQGTSFGPWKNTFMFVSDDFDPGWSTSHTADAESISNVLEASSPIYNQVKLYGDAYPLISTPSGNKLVALNKALNDQIFLGTFMMNYSGHGAPTRLSQEDILTVADINSWKNINKLPVIVTATCDFGRFDDPNNISGGARAFLKTDGGSIASVTTTQLVYASQNKLFNTSYTEKQFTRLENGKWRTLGEALRQGKNAVGGSTQNNVKYTLLGDPALTLALPRYNVETDSLLVNEGAERIPSDSIKALGNYILKGSVKNEDGVVIDNFNGKVYVTIFDKRQTVELSGPKIPVDIKSFKVQNSIIYKGQATVTSGRFSLSFVVPKDINYSFGKGKISYYADNGSVDAAGADTGFTVGGFSASAASDNEGPVVQPYIDSDKFRDGGVTGPDPLLFVKLYDDNGINVTGSSVGHDLIAVLDGNVESPYILNNYYETAPDDFRNGTVSFPMAGLAEGRHTLWVRAWDTYNNSGEGEVTFEVVNKDKGAISEVYTYPNPFSDFTTFVIQHNLSKQELDVTIQIFNNAGSLVKTIDRKIVPEGNRTEIQWDGRATNGFGMGNGIYFYRIQIKSATGVSATAYEKLVLLR